MTSGFDRETVLATMEPRLWRHLASNARPEYLHEFAEAILNLEPGAMRRLSAAHLLVSSATADMLDAAGRSLRVLPSTVSRASAETVGYARSPVNWPLTLLKRASTRDPTRFTSTIPSRRYDTWFGRLIIRVLHQCQELAAIAGLSGSGWLAEAIQSAAASAFRLSEHEKLREVTSSRLIPERVLQGLARNRASHPLIHFYRSYRDAVETQAPSVVRDTIANRVLAPASNDRLFELLIGFALIDALASRGFHETRIRLVSGGKARFSQLRRQDATVELWWQRSYWAAVQLDPTDSRYQQVQLAAGMRRSSLRPDFVLRSGANALMIEAKVTETDDVAADRVGIREALAYVKDAEVALADQPHPHALVVAWNSSGTPAIGPIVVASQHGVDDAVDLLLGGWGL